MFVDALDPAVGPIVVDEVPIIQHGVKPDVPDRIVLRRRRAVGCERLLHDEHPLAIPCEAIESHPARWGGFRDAERQGGTDAVVELSLIHI